MGLNTIINHGIDAAIKLLSEPLMPLMLGFWAFGMLCRALIFYTVSRQNWFVIEVGKRVDRFVEDPLHSSMSSFYQILKKVLERTYYEAFQVRGIMMRRRHDFVTSLVDRLFVIQNGCARLVKDALKQTRHLRHGGDHPKMLAISKSVMEGNPCFNKLFGVVPMAPVNDFLNMLPGLFIVGGIFGTFLGIMSALPKLGTMNLEDIEQSSRILDAFLLDVAYSMGTSVLGIILNVTSTVWNTFLNPERRFFDTVNRFENSLDILWNRSQDNAIPSDLPAFDENRDPLTALETDRRSSGADAHPAGPVVTSEVNRA